MEQNHECRIFLEAFRMFADRFDWTTTRGDACHLIRGRKKEGGTTYHCCCPITAACWIAESKCFDTVLWETAAHAMGYFPAYLKPIANASDYGLSSPRLLYPQVRKELLAIVGLTLEGD